jgi:ABC-2 type transport system permease protein
MRKILSISWKDVQVLFRDGAAVILMIGGPLVLSLGLGLVTGAFNRDDTNGIPAVPVALVDQDGGELAEALIEVFQSDDLATLVEPRVLPDAFTAKTQVDEGELAGAIIIPSGFTAAMMPDPRTGQVTESGASIEVYTDPGRPIGAGIVRSIVADFVSQVQTGAAAMQLTMSELVASGAVPPEQLPEVGRLLGEQLYAGAQTSAVSTASLVDIRQETAEGETTEFNPMAYIAPAMALLFLMYTVSLGGRSLLQEREEGTLPRMLTAPTSTTQVFAGKVTGIFLAGVAQTGVLILITTILFRLDWGSPLGVVLLVLAAAAAATGWGMLVGAVSRTPGQAASLGTTLMLLFGILGGSFVSLSGAGPVINALSRITPNAWALDGFTQLGLGRGIPALIPSLVGLLAMAVILFTISVMLFRRRQSDFLAA